MGKRVLVALDGSEQADHALEHALAAFEGETLVLLHVINPAQAGYGAQAGIPSYSEGWYEEAENRAEELFASAQAEAAEHDVEVETVTELGQPSRAIVEFARENDVDHIVMGSHGREGITRILLGSVAETVVRRAPVPVTVVR